MSERISQLAWLLSFTLIGLSCGTAEPFEQQDEERTEGEEGEERTEGEEGEEEPCELPSDLGPVGRRATQDVCDVSARLECEECPAQDPRMFEDCEGEEGAIFTGSRCMVAHRCASEDVDVPAFADLDDCARTCAEAGWCRGDLYPRYGQSLVCPPNPACFNSLVVCPRDSLEWVEEMLPSWTWSVYESDSSYPCAWGYHYRDGVLTDPTDQHFELCAATLHPVWRQFTYWCQFLE